MFSVDIWSATMLPLMVWLVRFSVTLLPFDPLFPQESFWILKKLPVLSLLIVLLFSLGFSQKKSVVNTDLKIN